jgi:hypothetical protein
MTGNELRQRHNPEPSLSDPAADASVRPPLRRSDPPILNASMSDLTRKDLLHELINSMSDQQAASLLELLVTERQTDDPLGQELVDALAQIRTLAEELQP